MSRERVRWGGTYEYCTNSQWWREGNYDSVTGVFTRNGESFQVLSGDVNTNHRWIRLRQFWQDTYEEPLLVGLLKPLIRSTVLRWLRPS